MRYQIWNKTDSIITPSGAQFTAEEWAKKYPFPKMIITAGVVNGGAAMEFYQTVEHYKKMGAAITDDMSDEEILAAIEDFEDHPPEGDPTNEERIAAALEAQVLMSMPETQTVSLQSEGGTAPVIRMAVRSADAQPSAAFKRVKRNVERGLWSAALVQVAVNKGEITSDEAADILGA